LGSFPALLFISDESFVDDLFENIMFTILKEVEKTKRFKMRSSAEETNQQVPEYTAAFR
jgi:hypothetical protein